jgi:S-adenosylmethionine:tRNA ribosyltransferase-isomerase
MFDIEEYNYDLPPELIAQVPCSKRDHSRLLLVDRRRKSLSDHHFFDLPELLYPGDLLVVNDTKVIRARLFGRKETGGQVEVLVLEHAHSTARASEGHLCLMKSSKRPKPGGLLFFKPNLMGKVEEVGEEGLVKIMFSGDTNIAAFLDAHGYMPLPPYIKREKENHFKQLDKERYQTIFSKQEGAVAAPTAGLHFTEGLLDVLKKSGVIIESLTLHVGNGTFRPVRTKDIRKHHVGKETYGIGERTAKAIKHTRESGGRVIAVGTTVVRALETAIGPDGGISPGEGETDLLITPGFSFKAVNALITNFHLPKSSLLFLVSAFAGLELIMAAYKHAIENKYRFYSYGDAMLIT